MKINHKSASYSPVLYKAFNPGSIDGRYLTLTVQSPQLMHWTLLNRIITAQWEGMGEVGSARYEPALLPPCPTIRVLSYSN